MTTTTLMIDEMLKNRTGFRVNFKPVEVPDLSHLPVGTMDNWRFEINVTRAVVAVNEKHGYLNVLSYSPVVTQALAMVAAGEEINHEFLDILVDRELVDDNGITLLGQRLLNILPLELHNAPAPDHSKLAHYLEEILSTVIDMNPAAERCPVCGDVTIRLESSQSGFFWKCKGVCGKFFSDANGKIVKPAPCPKCKENSLSRFESKKKPGAFFWRCAACEAFFSDDNGKPGNVFGDEETTQCPACPGQAIRRLSIKGKDRWYWHCPACGNFEDESGKIGRATAAPTHQRTKEGII